MKLQKKGNKNKFHQSLEAGLNMNIVGLMNSIYLKGTQSFPLSENKKNSAWEVREIRIQNTSISAA